MLTRTSRRISLFSYSYFFFTVLLLLCSPASGEENYILGGGDVLTVSVYSHEDLKTTTRVSGDGTIQISLIGPVKVGGMTTKQAIIHITKLYADGYLVDPRVNVFIEEFRSKKAILFGQVMKPGVYELSGPTTLLELISMAGGLKEKAGDVATIRRESRLTSATTKMLSINLKALMEKGDLTENIQIQDRDNIFVAEAGLCYVTGEVEKPNAYKVEDDTTVMKLITLAGGFTDMASRGSVKIVRVVNGVKEELEKVALDAIVQPDDVVVVQESFF